MWPSPKCSPDSRAASGMRTPEMLQRWCARGFRKLWIGLMLLSIPALAAGPVVYLIPAEKPGAGQDVSAPQTALRATV